MKRWMIIFIVVFTSCNGLTPKTTPVDSLGLSDKTEAEVGHMKDRLRGKINAELVGTYIAKSKNSPVIISGAKVTKEEYGSKILSFTIKNNTDKTVNAVRFGYSLFNNFGENVSEADISEFGFSWKGNQMETKPCKHICILLSFALLQQALLPSLPKMRVLCLSCQTLLHLQKRPLQV